MNELATRAQQYAQRGIPVFPIHSMDFDICSCHQPCESPAKHPRTRNGLKDATTDISIISEWWSRWPCSNIGIVTGSISGIVVLDVDPRHGGDESLKELQRLTGQLPRTATVKTGGGGWHYIFKHPGEGVKCPNQTNMGGLAGLDVRGDGGYIVAPPSIHASGRRYCWLIQPIEAGFAELPLFPTKAPRTVDPDSLSPVGAIIPAGQRDNSLASLAGTMYKRGICEEAVYAALHIINAKQCQPPLSEMAVERIVRSVLRYHER